MLMMTMAVDRDSRCRPQLRRRRCAAGRRLECTRLTVVELLLQCHQHQQHHQQHHQQQHRQHPPHRTRYPPDGRPDSRPAAAARADSPTPRRDVCTSGMRGVTYKRTVAAIRTALYISLAALAVVSDRDPSCHCLSPSERAPRTTQSCQCRAEPGRRTWPRRCSASVSQ
jgi:hypothetical protein